MRTVKISTLLLVALCPAVSAVRAAQTGSLCAWGDNTYGQTEVPYGNDFVAIAGGWSHSLALKSDGSIAAWGDNSYGQCDVPSPNTDFAAIAAGAYHNLGLKNDGSIVAWGGNTYGQCNVPSPNTGFIAIDAGRDHSLGLKNDGSLVAWGRNSQGQCNLPSPNTGFVAVSGGADHSLGLKSDGSIVAWGYNNLGQCDVPSPNTGFVAVAACYKHSLGLKNDGSIVAWGGNSAGECNVPAPNSGFAAIAGGESDSLGLKSDGSIVAWGYNAYGQCDVPTANIGFIGVAAGLHHAVAIKTATLGGSGTDNYIPRWFGASDLEDSAIYQTDAGHIGIGTTTPICPLDVAGALNLNKGKTGIALTVNGKEAVWSNDTYFSWGYGGAANFFADDVGIGPDTTNPAERLDLSWTGGVNARIGRYNYLGSCFSSATLVLGNNVRARTDNVNGIVVGNQHQTYGYRAITLSTDGIQFYGRTGGVKAGDPLDAATERMRIANDGNVGIGTTTPAAKLDIESGTGTYPSLLKLGNNVPGNVKARHYVYLGSGYGRSHGITLNYDRDSGAKDVAQLSAIDLGLGVGGTAGQFPGGGFFFHYLPPGGSDWITAMHINHETGNVGIGTTSPSEKLDVDGAARLRKIAAGYGTTVVVDQNGKLCKQSSSQKYKTNIRDLEDDPDRVLGLRPVRFQWTTTGQDDIGLIAEEVEGVLKDLVIEDSEGKPEAVKYEKMSLYLLQVVKGLKSENEALRQQVDLLDRRVERLERHGSAVAQEVQP
jgi:alpha-tubulin suppressor-like RCC1 family protein